MSLSCVRVLTKICRHLKATAQLTGLFPPDQELTRPTQQLFEQFFLAHGIPNDAEAALLQAVGYVEFAVVDAWCKPFHKHRRSNS